MCLFQKSCQFNSYPGGLSKGTAEIPGFQFQHITLAPNESNEMRFIVNLSVGVIVDKFMEMKPTSNNVPWL